MKTDYFIYRQDFLTGDIYHCLLDLKVTDMKIDFLSVSPCAKMFILVKVHSSD